MGLEQREQGKRAGGKAGLVAEVGALWLVSQELGLDPLQAHGGPAKSVKPEVSVYVYECGGVHRDIICIVKDNISYKKEPKSGEQAELLMVVWGS